MIKRALLRGLLLVRRCDEIFISCLQGIFAVVLLLTFVGLIVAAVL